MLKQLLASVGIGACKIDTRLHSTSLVAGGTLAGEIHIRGGEVAQQIDGFSLSLQTRVKVSTDNGDHYQNHSLQRFRVAQSMLVAPGSQHTVPFQVQLTQELPVTQLPGYQVGKLWLSTEADVSMALDPSDQDLLQVTAPSYVLNCIQAMLDLGFQLQKVDVEKGFLRAAGLQTHSGCYQEFEFRPRQWLSGVREVELSFVPQQQEVAVLIELDRVMRGDSYKLLRLPLNASVTECHRQLSQFLRY